MLNLAILEKEDDGRLHTESVETKKKQKRKPCVLTFVGL